MIESSARAQQARLESHQPLVIAQVITPGEPITYAEIVDGQITADRTRAVRYNLDATLSSDIDVRQLDATGTHLRVWHGIDFAGTWTPEQRLSGDIEMTPAGTYRLEDVETGLPRDRVQLTGLGREAHVVDDRFLRPEDMPNGLALTRLVRLITESVPGGASVDLRVPDQYVAGATWDEERWGGESAACQMLARSAGAEVYADALGGFVVRATPSLEDASTGSSIKGGERGNRLQLTRSYSREGAANVIVASSSRTDGGADLGSLAEWDRDPYSPTFLHPTDPYVDLSTWPACTFGRVVRRVSSPLPESVAQLAILARSYLADSRGLLARTGMTVLPDPTIEPGDLRIVQTDLGWERQLVDSWTLPLTAGPMSLTCRSVRIDRG